MQSILPKTLVSGLGALLLTVFAIPSPAAGQDAPAIKIGTGGSTGVYFVVGNAICRMMRLSARRGQSQKVNCAAPPSGGSIENLSLLQSREVDVGVVQSDWQYHAFNGSSIFDGKPFPELRALFSVHVEPFHIVARKGSGIEQWDDLWGKRVNVGNVGSGQRATFEELIREHGRTMEGFSAFSELSSSEQAGALCANEIDAFGFTVGVPNASIAQATDGCEGTIIDLDTPVIRTLVDGAPYYQWTTIPDGTYFTTDKDVRTLGVLATVVSHADVDEDIVYALVKSVHMNMRMFTTLHPAFAMLNSQNMTRDGLSVPLHPGAERAYKELGIME